jgi:exonuclease SbcD
VWVASDYATRLIQTKRGPVVVGAAPYPIRARLMQDITTTGLTIAQTDALLQQELTKILDSLAAEADTLAGETTPRLLTGHFTISGAVVGSERNIMLGRDVSVLPSSVADPRWDYVALGHVHKHQNLTKGREGLPPVVYSGSIERIDFGEEGDAKGFCWVELERHNARWEFVELDARRFVTLWADLQDSHNPTQEVVQSIEKHNLKEAIVRLNLTLSPDSEARLNENTVRDALRRASVFSLAAIRKDVEQPTRARLGASPEGLSHAELLERYLINREVPPERREELLRAAQEIFDGGTGE